MFPLGNRGLLRPAASATGCERPAVRSEQEAMVSKVVVDVRSADEEHDAAPELLEIASRLASLPNDAFAKVEVACSLFAVYPLGLGSTHFDHAHCVKRDFYLVSRRCGGGAPKCRHKLC